MNPPIANKKIHNVEFGNIDNNRGINLIKGIMNKQLVLILNHISKHCSHIFNFSSNLPIPKFTESPHSRIAMDAKTASAGAPTGWMSGVRLHATRVINTVKTII